MTTALNVAACSDDDANGPATFREATQTDRFGLPGIATVFIPTDQRDAYNEAAPAGDPAAFGQFVVDRLTAFGHPDPAALADALLPDIQPINTSQESGFLNGRRLQDDVITAELGLIFGANPDLNDDYVDANDRPFLPGFPYLAAPHRP
ncbi:MAG TPA: DUF4331 family protein [Gemmatimonadales bacterium]|nr:DUF4331 family protein [Gemmatimonadales bacterium]